MDFLEFMIGLLNLALEEIFVKHNFVALVVFLMIAPIALLLPLIIIALILHPLGIRSKWLGNIIIILMLIMMVGMILACAWAFLESIF